ncbi:MAG: alcohol dehydrogenase catalytic domain-containing protein [Acidobacteria bacterium]|nr:alcohol dehydrogenase catalytic domain-containing protein [Acidobacteriota bacterium]
MKAVRFEGKEKMSVAELPVPECGDGEVLLKVAACGICGGDARSFFSGDRFASQGRIPGHEAAGVVVGVGQGVSTWRTGDRVALAAEVHCHQCWYCRRELFQLCADLKILGKHMDGGLADYMLLTRAILERGVVNRVPAGLSLLHAAVSEPICSVLASHEELGIEAGETVAVIGSGPMGILHFELLRARDAKTILIDLSAGRLERARRDFGAAWTIDASKEDPVARVGEITGGIGADVAITAAPSAAAVAQSIRLVRKRGRIGLFGGVPADQAQVALDVNRIHYDELRMLGNFSYHPRRHREALELLASGRIRCERLITRYPIEETGKGLYDIRDGKVLKALVIPNNGELL